MTNSTPDEQSGPLDQEFSKEALEGFLAGLRANQQAPSSSASPALDNEALQLFEDAKKIFMAAIAMGEEGADADTPLAKLLTNQVICSIILSIAMSPVHNEFEKARLIVATTIIGIKENNIVL